MRRLDHSCLCSPGVALLLALGGAWIVAQSSPAALPPGAAAVIIALENDVQVKGRGNTVFNQAHTNQFLEAGDSLKTGRRSSAVLRYADNSVLRIDENFVGQIHAPVRRRSVFETLKGRLFFLHRGGAADMETRTPGMSALILGTEFVLEVADDGTSTLSLIDGQVAVTNELGGLSLRSGEQVVAAPGQPPRTARLDAASVLQWCLYYPAVLRLEDLDFTEADRRTLGPALDAYRSGDLPAALHAYPPDRQPTSDDERLFLAALLLAMGQARESETLVDKSLDERLHGPAAALRTLMAAVNGGFNADRPAPIGNTPSAHLAQSYLHQARGDLPAALASARQAAEAAPDFSFAQARLGELEFSFGRIAPAREAIERSLAIAPRNAQAHTVRGFLLAAHNRTDEAIGAFDQALAIDPRLGNAWLGRGLCRIKQGQTAAGRQDLQTAAAVEPTRAVLRSYLGKAFDLEGDRERARHELTLAGQIDPNDPTAWLYSALLNQQSNRINEGIRDLEHAQTLGGHRWVERSSLLLDQDDAVRGANLAALYRDAGLSDVSQREAALAVNTDYTSASAHLFLADSFNELRDPRQFQLRYETPWLSEYLVANLLAPVGAGSLSPSVTQQEYSRLFDRNRLGFASATEYRSSGDWFQSAVQHGTYENFSYAAEAVYRSENGHRPNSDVEQRVATLRLKHQFTPADSLFAQATLYRGEGGDVRPLFDERDADLSRRTDERQTPLLLAGWNHQWSPGVNTLLLAGMVDDTFTTHSASNGTLLIEQVAGTNLAVVPGQTGQRYRTESLAWTAELQQLCRAGSHTAVFGGRYQAGDFATRNSDAVTDDSFVVGGIPVISSGSFTNTTQRIDPRFERWSAYAYDYWRVWEPLTLIGGLSYDALRSPENFLQAPVTAGEKMTHQLSPKAGLVWTPHRRTTVRAAYSRSLGGVAQDRSLQLEPSQIAGIIQSYRSVIPEAVAGAIAAPRMDILGVALDQKFTSGTYVGLHAEWLESEASRRSGAYVTQDLPSGVGLIASPGGTRERFDYMERSFSATLDQILGREWSLGARYRVSVADLTDDFTDLHPPVVTVSGFSAKEDVSATLHQVLLRALYNHPGGFFGQFEAVWSSQSNHGYSPERPGDDFWQLNAWGGFRLPNRRLEVRLGLLNLTGRDYRLNPLNVTVELPRERTFFAGLRFHF